MKRATILLLIIVSFLSYSCNFFDGQNARILYEIRNESDYRLQISAFNNGIDGGSMSLASKEIVVEGAGTSSAGPYTIFGGSDPQSVDSVVISFDNRRFIIQYCNGEPLIMANRGEVCPFIDKNIMGFYGRTDVYKRINKEYIAYKFLYIFDNTDYEKAIEL